MNKLRLIALVITGALVMAGCDSCGGDEQVSYLDNIPIIGQGVSSAQFTAAVANINAVWNGNGMSDGDKLRFKNKVTVIHIVSGSTVLQGTTLNVASGATVTAIEDYILDHVTNV